MTPVDDVASNIYIISSALGSLGYTWNDMSLGGSLYRQFSHGGIVRWTTYMQPALAYPMVHSALRQISRNKTAANDYVQLLGYSTPRTVSITVDNEGERVAEQLLQECGAVVVKPVYGSLSRGVIRNISDEETLSKAIRKALSVDDEIIVQEQVFGDEVRLLIVDSALATAVLRQRPQVVGDGTSSIEELIVDENNIRQTIQDTMVPYPMLNTANCDKRGLDMETVPESGEVVVLGYGSMIANGASVYDVSRELADGYKKMAEHIATSLGARMLVVDVIVDDVREFKNYRFLEFNTSPVLKLFYSCRDGKHADVAPRIADAIHRITA